MKLDILRALNEERRARRAAVLVTDLADGAQRFVKAADISADPLADALDRQLRMGKSATVEIEGKHVGIGTFAGSRILVTSR